MAAKGGCTDVMLLAPPPLPVRWTRTGVNTPGIEDRSTGANHKWSGGRCQPIFVSFPQIHENEMKKIGPRCGSLVPPWIH